MGYAGIVAVGVVVLLAGCTRIPRTAQEGTSEISKVRDAIECELAAVASDGRYAEYALSTWTAKTNLQLTLVSKLGADGKVVWVIPHGASPIPVTPTASLGGTDKSIAALDFSTKLADALRIYGTDCLPGPDPSGTGMGLAAWFESTLQALREGQHAGLSFTSEFELAGAAGARFGYTITRLSADAGVSGSRVATNRFTVAVAAPPGKPKPIEVVIVGERDDKKVVEPQFLPGARIKGRPSVPAAPADNTTLNRLLDRQAPVRLEPQ
jgi:hypothetical protein